jgi:drug/metabolite transporter (DMT)-like permease
MSSLQVEPPVVAQRGYAGVLVAAASWGTWTLFLRFASAAQPIAPALCSFVVLATIGIVLFPLALRATRRRVLPRSAREWWLIGAFGLTDALNCVLYFGSLAVTSVGVAVLTHYLAPLFVATFAPLVLGERRRPGTFLAVLIGLSGLTLLLAPWNVQTRPGGRLLEGALLGLGSAFFYALSVLSNKRLSRSFEPSEMLVYHMPSALILVALLVPQGGWTLTATGLSWLLLGALGPGVLAGVIFMRSLTIIPAAHASVLTLVEPFTALVIAAIAWGESLEVTQLIGGAAILMSGYVVVREARPAAVEAR